MRIPHEEFLEKYKQLFIAKTKGIGAFPYWKQKYLIKNGETYCLPEHGCYYVIYNNHLVGYYSPDNRMHLTSDQLNRLDCISMYAPMYDSIKNQLTGFSASYGWGLCYDFDYRPKERDFSQYEAVDFDFSDESHYIKAAEIINGDGYWLNSENIKKIKRNYPSDDPSLFFFIREKNTLDLAAVSISAYEPEVKQTDLDYIFVAPKYQGKGCGRFLIEETIRRCKDKSDSICVGGMVDFYRKCGFIDDVLEVWAPKDGYKFKADGIQP